MHKSIESTLRYAHPRILTPAEEARLIEALPPADRATLEIALQTAARPRDLPRDFAIMLQVASHRVGIPRINVGDLRTTAAARALEAGKTFMEVAQMLGHQRGGQK